MSISQDESKKPNGFAIFLVVVALLGLTAAFALTAEKIHQLQFPGEAASCDFSVLVQCGKNLESWQGSLFGFPNPLLGLMGWPVVLATAAGIFAGAKFAAWYWRAFNVVALGGFIFVIWLYSVSVFSLGTLCPWCMVTWIATIPLFWVSTFWIMKQGAWGSTAQRWGEKLLSWALVFIVATIAIEAVIAQIYLDWVTSIFL